MSAAHIADLARFVTASPSSFHAAAEVARRLGVAASTLYRHLPRARRAALDA